MSKKTTITDARGLVVSNDGSGTTISNAATFSSTVTLDTLPKATLQAKTAAATLTAPGVYTVSGSSAFNLTMPLASAVPGGVFVIRTLSAHAHGLTGSAESNGTLVFCDPPGSGATHGSKVAVEAVVGGSVSVVSDGLSFCVFAASGSHTISGT